MISFKKGLVGERFLNSLCNSYEKGEKRDLVADCQTFLKEHKIKYSINLPRKGIPQLPILIAANHYARTLIQRKSLLTTIDSMITSSIVTVAVSKISKRKLIWIIKDNLVANILFYDLMSRKAQIAAITTYDFIGVSKNYPFSKKSAWLEKLNKGYNVAFYPEGGIGQIFKRFVPGFVPILSYLQKNGPDFQVLPIAIYLHQGAFRLKMANPISGSLPAGKIVNLTKTYIESLLPQKSKEDESFKSQQLPQPADDQKPKLAELEAI